MNTNILKVIKKNEDVQLQIKKAKTNQQILIILKNQLKSKYDDFLKGIYNDYNIEELTFNDHQRINLVWSAENDNILDEVTLKELKKIINDYLNIID